MNAPLSLSLISEQLRDIAFCIPSSAHSEKFDADCDWLLRNIAARLDAMCDTPTEAGES